MARILVILETSSFRQPLAESLRGAGYETDISENCRRGMAKAVAAPPNVIVLDPAMEGKNGWDVIRRCRLDPSLSGVRIILVTTVADRKTVLLAAQFGIRDFLIKSREISRELIERLRRYYPPGAAVTGLSPAACPAPAASPAPPEKGTVPLPATGQIPSLLTREQCLARVEKASANRPISGVAGQVMNLASSPLAEMSELAELIGKDPVFATRILRAANSAAFSGRRKGVTTIADAVRNIGISTIADIATALTVFEAVPCGDSGNFNYIRSWQHSFATAMICQQLAKLVNPPDAGAAYLVGLCHDMGQIVFRSEFNSEYDQVLKFAAETGLDLETAERQMLGVVQLDLARLILRKLGLPDAIRQPIEEFQSLQRQPGRRPALPLARLLRCADLYANGMLLAAWPTSPVGPFTKAECRAAAGCGDPPRPDAASIRPQILSLTAVLTRLPAETEEKLCSPIIEPSAVRVCLVRDAELSAFDPLEAALRSLAELRVVNSLKAAAESPVAALIVSSQRRGALATASAPVLRLALDEPPPSDPAAKTAAGGPVECGATISLQQLSEFLHSLPAALRPAA